MDQRADERKRQALHGLVTALAARLALQTRPASRWAVVIAALLIALVALSLVTGIAGGLLRVGVALPGITGATWQGQAALAHAALMVCGFMGTVIGIERAVAVKLRFAWLAPLGSGMGGLLLLLGHQAGAWLIVAASMVFLTVNLVVVRRQRAAHTWLLFTSACAWLTGNFLFALGVGSVAVLPWWFSFLVITVAAERLEMTRLTRRRPGAQRSLCVLLAAMLLGAMACAAAPRLGGLVYGTALLLLALWLSIFDIARRTVRAQGLPRYMAVCLLGGYAWLAVAGAGWAATALGLPYRDAAVHALGLGFVVSMMMGHAPVILPAVARVKLQFSPFFYVPLAVLHLSLAVRLGPGLVDMPLRTGGAVFNAIAIALFACTVVGAALAWRIRHGVRNARIITP